MAVLCQLADPQGYRAFHWRQDPQDLAYWLDLFARFPASIEQRLREDGLTGADFEARWQAFSAEYQAGIEARRNEALGCGEINTITLGEFRQSLLDKYGWPDPYVRVKQRENETAARMYAGVVGRIDAVPAGQRWELLLRGLFAGNMFDLGSPETIAMYNRGEIDFFTILARLPGRPWAIDDTDELVRRLESSEPWRQVLFFVDNAGADIVLGVIPAVRELARSGLRVVMAANSTPALNDITYDELNPLLDQLGAADRVLGDLLAANRITTVASGSGSPLINLSRISDECNAAAADSDLIVLEGMGRAVESNWCPPLRCDAWRVALLKDRTVARWLGARLFDPVCRFDPAHCAG